MQQTIVVGDVHGCLDELEDLLKECGHRRGDRLVFTGDIVAKGPDSPGVVALARDSGALAVLGNHDAHALRARRDQATCAVRASHPTPERQKLLDTLTPADWDYLQTLPYWLRLGGERDGEPETVVVHAGVVPGTPIERQSPDHLLNLRSITASGEPSKRIEGTPWAALWNGPERIVFGHDAIRGLQQYPLATGLDTGCVYGGRLSALLLPERRLVSVSARRAYMTGG